jgi:hypothetical protein
MFTNVGQIAADGVPSQTYGDLTTAVTYQQNEHDGDGLEYGLDFRHSSYLGRQRPSRISLYEGYVGGRFKDGRVRARAGHLWMNDLGTLGSVAGAAVEARGKTDSIDSGLGRLRAGVFGGIEPNVYDTGYVQDVRKFGGYFAIDGAGARRHVVGYVTSHRAGLNERSVVTVANFVPVKQKFFLYQAAEYDVQAPLGRAQSGLTYLIANARLSPVDRLEFQTSYNRGRSIDVRGLGDDILNGRALTTSSLEGLSYESVSERVTVEPVRRLRVFASIGRDKNNRDDVATDRMMFGASMFAVRGAGVDVTASDTIVDRPTGRYHSRYVSVGRQLGRKVYVSGDYSSAVSVLRFSRSDGITIEQRPHTTLVTGSSTVNLTRTLSVMINAERVLDDSSRSFRVLSGLTIRY